jgi:hypothetical protein
VESLLLGIRRGVIRGTLVVFLGSALLVIGRTSAVARILRFVVL